MGRVLDPLLCVFLAGMQSVGIGACMHVWYTELTCISNGVSTTDIVVGKVLCVCVCWGACVCVSECLHACVCGIQSRLVYRIGPLERTLWVRSSALVCVDRWWGHSHCRAPLTTGVDIYPRVLPSAYCVLVAGPLPLQGALNHWGRYLPQGPTICILCACGGATPVAGRP